MKTVQPGRVVQEGLPLLVGECLLNRDESFHLLQQAVEDSRRYSSGEVTVAGGSHPLRPVLLIF